MLSIYLTEFQGKDGIYESKVIAESFDEAQEICDKRGFGEKPYKKGEDIDLKNATWEFYPKWIKSIRDNQCNAYMSESGFPTIPNPLFPQTVP